MATDGAGEPPIPPAPWRGPPPVAEQEEAPRPLTARPTVPTGGGHARTAAPIPAPPTPRPQSARTVRKPPLDTGRGYSKQSLYVKHQAPAFGFGSATREQAGMVTGQPERLLGKLSPGPAMYSLPASIGGKQPDGRKKDPPTWSMGTAGRFSYGYGKSEQRPAPGHYTLHPSVGGKQPDGRKQDPPMYGFGTGTREQAGMVSGQPERLLGKISPGPAKYLLPPSIGGKQPDGRKKDPPTWSLGARDVMHKGVTPEPGVEAPGPIYKVPAAVGPQPDGRIPNSPRYGLGASTRDTRALVFLGQEYQVGAAPNTPTPGPAALYYLDPGVGKQARAHKKTSPRVSFSRASRWAGHEAEAKRNTVPGPGHYG